MNALGTVVPTYQSLPLIPCQTGCCHAVLRTKTPFIDREVSPCAELILSVVTREKAGRTPDPPGLPELQNESRRRSFSLALQVSYSFFKEEEKRKLGRGRGWERSEKKKETGKKEKREEKTAEEKGGNNKKAILQTAQWIKETEVRGQGGLLPKMKQNNNNSYLPATTGTTVHMNSQLLSLHSEDLQQAG